MKILQDIQRTTVEAMFGKEPVPGETEDILNSIQQIYSKPTDYINLN